MSGEVALIIPARWGSERFPGKPLHPIAGTPLIRHVWERCLGVSGVSRVIVATDDDRIARVAADFGAEVLMTSPSHPSGTDRIAEVAQNLEHVKLVVNVQGDEPFIDPRIIELLLGTMESDPGIRMATVASEISCAESLADPNHVKVVIDQAGDALYFSRSPLPYFRNPSAGVAPLLHHGLYGFRRDFLLEFVSWSPGSLERTEGLEQLRALEHGEKIRVVVVGPSPPGIDTPEQVAEAERRLVGSIAPFN